jgi:hypothetical protein
MEHYEQGGIPLVGFKELVFEADARTPSRK